jgi:hypothetical protein
MPAPVVMGVIDYLVAELGVAVWDGEVQRQLPDGTDVTPEGENAGLSEQPWPAIKVEMSEGGMRRTPTFENSYRDESDDANLAVICWALTREELEGTTPETGLLNQIEALLAVEQNYTGINLGLTSTGSSYQFFMFNLASWTCVQEKEIRAQLGQLLYRGELRYQVGVNGAVRSRSI